MLRRFLTATLSAFILTLFSRPAHAASIHFQVTPTNLHTYPIGFQISSRSTKIGREYIVEVWRKPQMDALRFAKRMDEGLVKVTVSAREFSVEGRRNVKMQVLGKDRIRYRFIATVPEVRELSFCVGFLSYAKRQDGTIPWMPSADFYWFRLSDFKPAG